MQFDDTIAFVPLSMCQADRLLAFELAERDWFESLIDARPASFYTEHGVALHIATTVAAVARGEWCALVLQRADGAIVGRANLKNIDAARGRAEVGYRMAQQCTGQGLATHAVRHLQERARATYALRELDALVASRNAASARVVQKCGFVLEQADTGRVVARARWSSPVALYRCRL
jgi:ribosomal-protein-alanine N-acetyltransferase